MTPDELRRLRKAYNDKIREDAKRDQIPLTQLFPGLGKFKAPPKK